MLKHLRDFKNFINESIRIDKVDPASYQDETVTALPYSKLIDENRQAFLKKIVRISDDLGIEPLWLMHTIFHESEFDPKKKDRMSGAVGLLSFMPLVIQKFIDTESGKILTPNEVLQMSNIDQLDIIRSFYKTWFGRMNLKKPIVAGDFAAITFYPAVIKKDWEWEFPDYIVEKNNQMFKSFPSGGKSKKDYYEYIDQVFKNDKEYDDSNDRLLGNFTGAIAEPGEYENKKPLEYYRELLTSIEDPVLSQQSKAQLQDQEETEKFKQNDN
jgi:hypothetical protein